MPTLKNMGKASHNDTMLREMLGAKEASRKKSSIDRVKVEMEVNAPEAKGLPMKVAELNSPE